MSIIDQAERFFRSQVEAQRPAIECRLALCWISHPEVSGIEYRIGTDHDGEISVYLLILLKDDNPTREALRRLRDFANAVNSIDTPANVYQSVRTERENNSITRDRWTPNLIAPATPAPSPESQPTTNTPTPTDQSDPTTDA